MVEPSRRPGGGPEFVAVQISRDRIRIADGQIHSTGPPRESTTKGRLPLARVGACRGEETLTTGSSAIARAARAAYLGHTRHGVAQADALVGVDGLCGAM